MESRTTGFAGWFVKRQGWLFFPLLTLEGLNLHAESVRGLLRPGKVPQRGVELALVGTRLTAYVVALLVLLPPTKAVAFFVVQMAVFGLCLGGSFAPSHKGMPIVPPTAKIDFFRRQVLMSRNVRGGLWVDFFMGGLNYQIEHHLFPNMPRPNLKRVQPLIRDYCAQHGAPYTRGRAVRVLRDRRELSEQRRPAGTWAVRVPDHVAVPHLSGCRRRRRAPLGRLHGCA